ncbi:Adenylate kinase 7 [Schistosoma japonicum]|uniref:Adenylate kinase 7 n=1 Tax=Schistosoma japonicum TaxID=6182 RepID=A0A4Z2DFI0_SCHJA|nr:Adenylate kinase 7 [Schistosoma japonicum]
MSDDDESPKSKNIFVSEMDCFVGKNVGKYLATQSPGVGVEDDGQVTDLSNEKQWEPSGLPLPKKNRFMISGTLRYSDSNKPSFAKDILDYENRKTFLEHVLLFDVIIYDITVNPEQMKEVLWLAECLENNSEQFSSKKTFIMITNLMSWLSTRRNDPDDPGFLESEYKRRRPHPRFKEYLECEKSIFKLGKKKFVTYVLACGVFYGCGEHLFQHLFKEAWSTQNELPIYLNGDNILPTVHILDLARVIQCIIDNPPKQRYIVVRDDSQFTLSEIVKSISSGLSNGITRIYNQEDMESMEIPTQIIDVLTMNLLIEPSTIKDDMQFPWISDSGIPTNISQLINEFIEEHKLKPLRICILGPPCIGKTTLTKELCKIYRLHHISLKGLLYECIRNLLEPIKAHEHLLALREKERLAAETNSQQDTESTEKILSNRNSRVSQLSLNANEIKSLATDVNTVSNYSPKLLQSSDQLLDSYEYDDDDDDDRTILTEDNIITSHERRSTSNDELTDLEFYPLSPLPTWNSEDELEMLVNDCQERLEQLRDNCNEFGKLNDETLIRLLVQKLLSKPCQNQGFILDGFPKTLEQAELLFRPDPEDEDILNNDNIPQSHRFITPHFVVHLIGSNNLVLRRFESQFIGSNLDPTKANVMLPSWKTCLIGDKYIPKHLSTNSKQQTSLQNETEQTESPEEVADSKQLETQKQIFDRRLQAYRASMAPNAAALRGMLINEANLLQGENHAEKPQTGQTDEDEIPTSLSIEDSSPLNENDSEMKVVTEENEHFKEQNLDEIDVNQQHTLTESVKDELRLAYIPSIPEIPDETEENVLTYFDIREIHPIIIDMDKDFSPLVTSNGPQERCLEKVRKAIGQRSAPKLPSIEIYPLKQTECKIQEKALKSLKEFKLKQLQLTKDKIEKQKKEEMISLEKCQNDWNNWLSLLNTQNYQYAEAHSLPMRHYLMKYIMPELSKALLDCSEIRPDDPVDFVAEYLLKTGVLHNETTTT